MKKDFLFKLVFGFAILILSAIVLYIAGSWAAASFNIKEWKEITRIIISVIWVIIVIIGWIIQFVEFTE